MDYTIKLLLYVSVWECFVRDGPLWQFHLHISSVIKAVPDDSHHDNKYVANTGETVVLQQNCCCVCICFKINSYGKALPIMALLHMQK
jgi:hypothetical protein